MPGTIRNWRKRNRLTQVDAASLLGFSQPYLSLLENGARPFTPTLRSRMKAMRAASNKLSSDTFFAANLSALGYPGFAHLPPARSKSTPEDLLILVLAKPDADARVAEALPWLVRQFADKMDLNWVVRQAKLRNSQNRLGFLLQLTGVATPKVLSAVRELECARQLRETTFCWDSMPAAARAWIRANRTPLAAYWNVVTRLGNDAA
ncbi:MAG: helix-turn-helix domain-containing protein [Bryobacteraceae bacterium]